MASQGPLYPSTVANLSNAGTLENKDAWVNPSNAGADDGTETTITAATFDTPDISQILVCSNFGFSIPSGATIDGIVVEIDRRNSAGAASDNRVQLAKGTAFGDLVGSDKADTATDWPTSTASVSYGASTDLWGATWSDSEINASSFAVFLSVQADANNTDIQVDYVRVTVHYTGGGGGGGGGPTLNASATDSNSVSSHTITVASPGIAAGNHAAVVGIEAGGRTLTSVTDSQSNAWQVDETLSNTTNHGGGIASSLLTATLSAGDTITLNFSGTGTFAGSLLDLGADLDTSAWTDISVSQANASSTTLDSSTGGTSDTADELQIGVGMHAGTPALTPETLSPAWNHLDSQTTPSFARMVRTYYRIVSGTEAQRFNGTLGTAQVNTGFFVSYRIVTAGGSVVTRTVADSLTLGNSVIRSGGFARTASDSLGLANAVARIGTFLRTVGAASSGNPGTLVQSAANQDESVGIATVSCTLGATPTAGNTLIAFVWERIDGGDTFSLDNGTWTQKREEFSGSGTNWPQRVYVQEDIPAGRSATTTLTVGTPSNARGICVVEIEGPVDYDTDVGASNTATTSGSITPTASTIIALLSGAFNRTDSAAAWASPAGSMAEIQEVKRYAVNHQRVTSSSGSYTVGSTGANANSSYIGIALKQGTGGGGDGLTFSDSVVAQKVTVRSVADSLGLADSVSRSVALIRSLSDSITLGNSVVRVLTLPRTVADSLGLTDSVNRVLTAVRTASDGLTLGSTVDAIKVTARTVADTLTLGNSVSRTGTFLRTTSDTLGLSDSVSRTLTLIRTAADGLTLGNVVNGTKLIVRSVADTLTLGDSVARVVSLVRTATDGLTLGNTVSRTGTFLRSAADGLGLTDAVTRGLAYTRTVADSLTFGNAVSATKIIVRSVADSLSFVDSVVRSIGGGAVVIGGVPPRIAGAIRAGMTSLASRLHPDGGRGDHPHPTGRGDHPKPGG